jgi:invasion protein IalB
MRKFASAAANAMFVTCIISSAALAQQADTPATRAKPALDLNQVVCEREQDTGSRLTAHKVCMTRSQWAEQRRLNRLDVDKIQTQRPCTEGGTC